MIKKNPIPVILPVLAVIVALLFGTCREENTSEYKVYSIEQHDGSYFLVGNLKNLESVKLSDGKKLTWNKQTGEIVYCQSENGINRLTITWETGGSVMDTIISTDANMRKIILDNTAIQSSMNFECPLEPIEVGDFTVSGPDKNCRYQLSIMKSLEVKGYKENDVQVSLTGRSGKYNSLRSWKRETAKYMEVWIKVKDQLLMITPNRSYSDCVVFTCDQEQKDAMIKKLQSDLIRYISSYNYDDQVILTDKRKFKLFRNGQLIELKNFFQEVEVNGFNMDISDLPNAIKIISASIEDDCQTFEINYENN